MAKKIALEEIHRLIASQGKQIAVQGKQLGALSESVEFMIDRMATKEDIRDIVRTITRPGFATLEERIEAVENKIAGTNRRLDMEALRHADLKLPKRVHKLEQKVFKSSSPPERIPM